MAISYATLKEDETGKESLLTRLFGEKAAVNENSILLHEQDSAADQADSLTLDPNKRTPLQKLISIFEKDGPQAAFDKAISRMLSGDIDRDIVYKLVDKIYETGYRKEAEAFHDELDCLGVDPVVIAHIENEKRREEQERELERQRQLQIEAPDPRDPRNDPRYHQFKFG